MKHSWIASVFLLVIAGAGSTPCHAEIISGNATVLVNIALLKQALDSSIANAESSGTALTIQAGEQLRRSIDAWEKANSRLLNQTLQGIGAEREAFFRQAEQAIEKLNLATAANIADAQQAVAAVNQTVASLTFDSTPVVFSVTPSAFVPGRDKGSGGFPIRILGANLGSGYSAKLMVAGTELEPSTQLDTSLAFLIPSNLVRFDQNKILHLKLQLVVQEPPGWFGWLVGRTEHLIPIDGVLLPSHAAAYSVNHDLSRTEKVYSPDELSLTRTVSGHRGPGSTCSTFSLQPTPGWKFVWGSLRIADQHGNAGGTPNLQLLSEFSGVMTICNSEPAPFSPGTWTTTAAWKEYQEREVLVPQERMQGILVWTEQEEKSLPDNARNVNVEVRMFNGDRSVGDTTLPYLQVHYDEIAKKVKMKPVAPLLLF